MQIPQRTLLLIGGAVGVIIILIVGAVMMWSMRTDDSFYPEGTTPIPMTASVESTAVLSFSPTTTTVSKNSTNPSQVAIQLDAGSHSVSGVQLELFYDNTVLRNVEIFPAQNSLMGVLNTDYSLVFRKVDQTTGKAYFNAGILPTNTTPRTGSGTIATVSFSLIPGTTKTSTPITFVNRSVVTQLGVAQSVLKTGNPLIIKIQ